MTQFRQKLHTILEKSIRRKKGELTKHEDEQKWPTPITHSRKNSGNTTTNDTHCGHNNTKIHVQLTDVRMTVKKGNDGDQTRLFNDIHQTKPQAIISPVPVTSIVLIIEVIIQERISCPLQIVLFMLNYLGLGLEY
ncbi:hypothetical protein LOAG_03418 [Loa loa]|uniref:Uncharacterized protein n=1 Tax=Loa loa TaxID=7209 RepID=A0A1S0U6E7_LOALO|nr:hypothetical protein LOAG_03418 [Loa loa]EFO25061.1 hypothetical protein LOAG_03418 [Loa loa]